MSTSSIVGIATGKGFKGRYVHWDGYPAGVGQALAAIIRRDGAEAAIKTLTQDHCEWSTVTGETAPPKQDRAPGGDPIVAGYGIAYDTQDDGTYWFTQDDQHHGAEWAYAMTATTVMVWQREFGEKHFARMPVYDIAI